MSVHDVCMIKSRLFMHEVMLINDL